MVHLLEEWSFSDGEFPPGGLTGMFMRDGMIGLSKFCCSGPPPAAHCDL